MFFNRKKKSELTPRQEEIRADVEKSFYHRLSRTMRNVLIGGAAAEMGTAVLVDAMLTGGTGTAMFAISSGISTMLAGGAWFVHRDYKRDVLRDTLAISEREEQIKAQVQAAVVPPPVPSSAAQALLRLSAKHFSPPPDGPATGPGPSSTPPPASPPCPTN